tara:strand:+ start:6799 stop:7482 length:684 start_codon:yes stop_codon:yes gene_type:complete
MSGISRISRGREQSRNFQSNPEDRGKEIWLKDGDQVFATPVATGEDNDANLDELYLYTFQVGKRWTNVLKAEGVDTSGVPEDANISHKFALWVYVYNIIHTEKRVDDWEEIEGPSGKKMYREDVNDYRIVSLGFGMRDATWNQLVDCHNDLNGLNKGVLRFKRTGVGRYDTSYQIIATPKTDVIPEDRQKEIKDLPTIKDYFMERYGKFNAPEGANGNDSSDDDELF